MPEKHEMTTAQRGHIGRTIQSTSAAMFAKYAKGAEEHGGNLWDHTAMQLIEMALDEAVDQVIYLSTLRDKMADEARVRQAEHEMMMENADVPCL